MASLCRSWVSVASLALYLVVNIGAATLHQHLDRGSAGPAKTACHHDSASPLDHDSFCLFCQVFHLARTLTLPVQLDVREVVATQGLPGSAVQSPCRLIPSIQARAPPLAG